jgi:hypothetical protein
MNEWMLRRGEGKFRRMTCQLREDRWKARSVEFIIFELV